MFLDLKELGFYYKSNDPFLGKCWYSKETFISSFRATECLYIYDYLVDIKEQHKEPLLIYAVDYDVLRNMKTKEKIKISTTSLINIYKFIHTAIVQ